MPEGKEIDVSATYKGFRLQAIYILYVALSGEDHWYYIPEKSEDLTIKDQDGKTKKLVQIKYRSNGIQLSTFDPQKRESFFRRIERNLAKDNNIEISAECFADISPELVQAFNKGDKGSRDNIREKLRKHNFKDSTIDTFFNRIKFNKQVEEEILKEVKTIINSTIGGAQPETTIALLTKWIYDCSEKKQGFTKKTLVNRINGIGEYLKNLRAYHSAWFTLIKPFSEFNTKNENKESLEQSFTEGMSARFEHILSNLDVIRSKKLDLVNMAFREKNIVVVHGASGQGKTTLAFRYINEYHPLDSAFYIKKIVDFDASEQISRAFINYAEKLDIPVLIYYDVESYNPNWVNILSELVNKKNIKILITIREENWRMTNVSYHSFPYKDIELDFKKEEAAEIFEIFNKKFTVPTALNFSDSWNRFGGKGPLLEYVYYLRKTRTLKSRLKEQLLDLETRKSKEYVDFLALISLLTKYGVKINLERLLAVHQVKNPMSLLFELEKEYFINIIRDVKPKIIEALHPIRSTIIYEILFEEGFHDWYEDLQKSIEVCYSEDLQFYLLNIVYDHFNSQDKIFVFFNDFQLSTWNELHAIYKAFQWVDIKNYYQENRDLINDIYKKLDRAWYSILDNNIARVETGIRFPFWKNSDDLSDGLKTEYENFYRRQSPKLEAFKLSEQFLKDIADFDLVIETNTDWLRISEVVYLVYYFNVSTSLDKFIGNIDYKIFLSFPIKILSKVTLAFFESKNTHFTGWYTRNKEALLGKYKEEMDVERIIEEKEEIKIEYFVKLLDILEDRMESFDVHKETMDRIDVLRELAPDKEKFSSNGYAQIFITEDQPDETHKRIKKENLIPRYLPNINATFQGIANYDFRFNDWREYYQFVISQRFKIINGLEDICNGLRKYFFKKKISDTDFVDEIREKIAEIDREVSQTVLLPKTVVDKFGIIYEGKDLSRFNEEIKPIGWDDVLAKFEFDEKYSDYFTFLKYYLHKAVIIFIYNSILSKGNKRRINNLSQIENLLPESELDIKHISLINLKDAYRHLRDYHNSFKDLFDSFLVNEDKETYRMLEAKEIRILNMLLPVWYHFAYFPCTTSLNASWLKESYIDDYLSTQLKKLIRGLEARCIDDYSIEKYFETKIDGDNSLIFQCDLKSPSDFESSLGKSEQFLFKYFKNFSYKSIDFYIMDVFRKQFVFLFTFKNKLLLETAFRITLHDLESKQSISNNYFLRSFPFETLKGLMFFEQFLPIDDEFLQCLRKAMAEFVQFIFVLEHFKNSLVFPFEDDVTNYEYMNKILKKIGNGFKEIFAQVEEIVSQCNRNDIPCPEARNIFQDYFSALVTEEGGTTFEISSNKLEEVIELMGNLIVAVVETILLYIKNRYDD